MSVLPPEILHQILSLCLTEEQPASALLTTSSLFHDVCQKIRFTNLHFTSRKQLMSFISAYGVPKRTIPHMPRSLELDITGDATHLVFVDIHALFSRCLSKIEDAERDEHGRPLLDLLRLRLNSHAFDFQIHMIYDALSLVNPRRFIWTGPDPPHHFSIATFRPKIVPQALPHLLRALAGYSNLIYLKLSHFNIGFNPYLPAIPSLQQLHLGQVIFLDPVTIASLLDNSGEIFIVLLLCKLLTSTVASANLDRISLVDAYLDSIWGPRLRRSDIETAATTLYPPLLDAVNVSPDVPEALKARIRSVVVCEAKTERIVGGDRVEDNRFLL